MPQQNPRKNDAYEEAQPRISIVTICMDNPSSLWVTCASVSEQTRRPRKHVVVDSSSKNLRQQMRSIAQRFNAEYLWVEPMGHYKAMERGLSELSDNDYVIFLNATDWFSGTRTLELIAKKVEPLLSRGIAFYWGVGKTPVQDRSYTYFLKHADNSQQFWKMLAQGTIGISHPSMICRASDLRKIGTFGQPWDLGLDYEFALSLGRTLGPPTVFDFPFSYYDQHGKSAQVPFATLLSKLRIRRKILRKNVVPTMFRSLFWATLRFVLRRLRDSQLRRTMLNKSGWRRFEMAPNQHFCNSDDDLRFPDCCEQRLAAPQKLRVQDVNAGGSFKRDTGKLCQGWFPLGG